jgi:hypothetical protein
MSHDLLLAVAVALPLAFSADGPGDAALGFPSTGPIRILSLSPARGTALRKGRTIEVDVSLASQVDSPGRVTLDLRDPEGNLLAASKGSVEVAARGRSRLRSSLAVPPTATSVVLCANYRPAEPGGAPTALCLPFRTRQ